MNATEIKEAINQYYGDAVICSVLQLKNPRGGHYIYWHVVSEDDLKLPQETSLLPDIDVTLKKPKKMIDSFL